LAGHLLVEAGESTIKGCGDLPEVQQMVISGLAAMMSSFVEWE
jgi:hypothetical protein